MKTYVGKKGAQIGGHYVGWSQNGKDFISLDPRFNLRNHSPDGFSWGYAGSGPAQLALALCVDALSPDHARDKDAELRALKIYQQFKFSVIASMAGVEDWTMTQTNIVKMIEQCEAAQKEIANVTPDYRV